MAAIKHPLPGTSRRIAGMVAVCGMGLLACGALWQSAPRAQEPAQPPPAAVGSSSEAAAPYRVQVADRLQISWRGEVPLSFTAQVRPDGNISMPFITGVVAVGRTTEEIAREIAAILSGHVRSPEVLVVHIPPPRPPDPRDVDELRARIEQARAQLEAVLREEMERRRAGEERDTQR